MRSAWYLAASIISCAALVPAAAAQEARRIVIADGPLAEAIAALSRQTGISIGTSGALPPIKVKGFSARLTVEQALRRILQGSGYIARPVARGAYRIERAPIASRPPAARPLPRPQPLPPPSEEILYPDILVTATKREADGFELPYSISTILPGDLAGTAGHIGTGTMVAFANGINKTNMGPGRNRLFIRGVADSPFNGPSQSTVALLLGDARINFDAPDPHLSLVDIVRVEVLKGPQGPLYGTGVLGGIYRVVPRAPDPAATSLQLGTGLGLTSGGAISHASDVVANLPLSGSLALRGVAYHERRGGWIDDPQRRRENVNSVQTSGGRLALQWTPDDWSFELNGTAQVLRAADSQYAAGPQGYVRETEVAEPHTGDFVAAQTAAERDFGDIKLRFNAAYVRHDFTNQFDATLANSLSEDGSIQVYQEERESSLSSQELRLSENHGQFRWLLGVNHLLADSELDWGIGSDPANVDRNDAYLKRHRELALFGDASLELTPGVTASAGLRLFHSRTEEFERFDEDGRHVHTTGLTPSASLAWHPSPGTMTWLRYSSAQRPGGLNPSAVEEPFAFSADRLHSYELGARLRRLDKRLTVEANLFALTWTDIQSDILLPSGLIGTANFGRAHNFGGEVLVGWRDSGFAAEAGATYQHGDIYADTSVFGRVDDAHLPAIPRLKAHARLSAALFSKGETSLRTGGTVQYTDQTRLSFDPALNRQTDSHAVFGAFVQFDNGRFRWTLSGENLTNNQADTFGFGNPFSIRQIAHRTPLRPRTVMLRMEWRN